MRIEHPFHEGEIEAQNRTGGTNRFWTLKIDRWRESQTHTGLRWECMDYSPHNAKSSTPDQS